MRLGSRGLREVNGRAERIDDDLERQAVRQRARAVLARSVAVAAVVTAAVLLVPR